MNCSASLDCSGAAGAELAEQFRVIAEIGGDIAFSIDCASGALRYLSRREHSRTELERKLAEYQRHYRDEPYAGEGTPHPEWGPYDHDLLARIETYVANIRSSS